MYAKEDETYEESPNGPGDRTRPANMSQTERSPLPDRSFRADRKFRGRKEAMKDFWRFVGRMTVVALAVVGLLALLGVSTLWAGMVGVVVLDVACILKLRQIPLPSMPRYRCVRLETSRIFLN